MSALNQTATETLTGGGLNPVDVLFTLPNTLTGGLYINIWLIGLYSVMVIGATQFNQRLKTASMYSSFVTFLATFLLVLFSRFTSEPVAGGNQLIPATVFLMGNLIWNYLDNGGIR